MKFAWQQIPSTIISDILCQNKFDGVVLDTEHGCFSNETLYSCIQIITGNQKKCFVRLTEASKTFIRYCLDAGADGLIFSTVETVEGAKKIHDYCKYPKFGGARGLGLVRENLWGAKPLVKEPPTIIAQIETVRGVANIESISIMHDFDYYMIGPYDLSASVGRPGQFNSERYLDMVSKVKEVIPVEKMAVHIPSDVKNELKKYENYGIVALGMDTTFLLEKYKDAEKYV